MTLKSRKSLPVALVTIAALVVTVLVLCWTQAYREQRQAERFLTVLRDFEVGKTRSDALSQALAPFGRYIQKSANQRDTEFDFWFDNRYLARLRLVPRTLFFGGLNVRNGVLVRKVAAAHVASCGCAAKVDETIRGLGFPGDVAPPQHRNHVVYGNWNAPNRARGVYVDNDDTYSAAERRSDLQFRLSCFTRIGGCSDARELLPNVRYEYRDDAQVLQDR